MFGAFRKLATPKTLGLISGICAIQMPRMIKKNQFNLLGCLTVRLFDKNFIFETGEEI